jgi:hypothetical protein
MLRRILLAAATSLVLAAPARAESVQDFMDFQSATDGIVLGPDGNFWVAESDRTPGAVVRMTPGGRVLNRFDVGDTPRSLALGPGGRVWVTVNGSDKLVWFDALAANPTAHDKGIGQTCQADLNGPWGIVDGGNNRMYFSVPGCFQIGSVAADGTGNATLVNARGEVYDLAVANGRLFAPDFSGEVVRRLTLPALGVEAQIFVRNEPSGIVIDGTDVYVTEEDGDRIAHFAVGEPTGSLAAELISFDRSLEHIFGLAVGADGKVYHNGSNGVLARVQPGSGAFEYFDVGGAPWQIVNGPDGELYFTDQEQSRVRRFVDTAPRVTTGAATAASPTAGSVTATVDPRGNATDAVFDYGVTTAYGATATVSVPKGPSPVPVSAVLSGLQPGVTYHVRVRASNRLGAATPGGDTTFTTPVAPPPPRATIVDGDADGVSPPLDCNDGNAAIRPGAPDKPGDKIDQDCNGADAPFPQLMARTTFGWGFLGARTVLGRVDISDLHGTETIKVICKGGGCPFRSKTFKAGRKNKLALGSRFGRQHPLRTGAKLEVRVTAPAAIGSRARLTIGRRNKDPKIVRGPLPS